MVFVCAIAVEGSNRYAFWSILKGQSKRSMNIVAIRVKGLNLGTWKRMASPIA